MVFLCELGALRGEKLLTVVEISLTRIATASALTFGTSC